MEINWSNWGFGGKTIFSAFCVAVLSMFVAWVDIGFTSRNGISQGTVLLLILWVYPVLKPLKNQKMSKTLGFLCAITSFLMTTMYISSKSLNLMGREVNVASTGAILFLIASLALMVGVLKYKPTEP